MLKLPQIDAGLLLFSVGASGQAAWQLEVYPPPLFALLDHFVATKEERKDRGLAPSFTGGGTKRRWNLEAVHYL